MRSRAVYALSAVCMFGCSGAEPATQDRGYAAMSYPAAESYSPLVARLQIEARAPMDIAVVLRLDLVNLNPAISRR